MGKAIFMGLQSMIVLERKDLQDKTMDAPSGSEDHANQAVNRKTKLASNHDCQNQGIALLDVLVHQLAHEIEVFCGGF